jgi:lipopolysaccharide transport system ATP-binding protein
LAFAVAAHLESEILIVDEVLAVGDAEFQKKCLGKMGEVSKGEGRTVLFVSHNMTSIQSLCNKSVYLEKGGIVETDSLSEAVSKYLYGKDSRENYGYYKANPIIFIHNKENQVKLIEVILSDLNGKTKGTFHTTEKIVIKIVWENIAGVVCSPNFQLKLISTGTIALIATDSPIDWTGAKKKSKGIYESEFVIQENWLNANDYLFSFALDSHSPRLCYEAHIDVLKITVIDPMDESSIARGMFTSVREDAVLWPALDCRFKKIN